MSETKNSPGSKRATSSSNRGNNSASEPRAVVISNRPLLKDPSIKAEPKEDNNSIEFKKPTAPLIKLSEGNISKETADEKEQQESFLKPSKDAIQLPENSNSDSVPENKQQTNAEQYVETDMDKPKNPTNLSNEAFDAAEAEKKAAHEAEILKLVDEKKYFLPINSVEKRRTKKVVILGITISLLLAIAWVDVALDAGLIRLGNVKPVTHFFSN